MDSAVEAAVVSGRNQDMPPETHSASSGQAPAGIIKARLVAFAREVGFDLCRVARCDPPPHARQFRDWLRNGAHGEMNYMQRGEEKRCDPQLVLPGVKSVIIVALNYFQGEEVRRPQTDATTGRVARHAAGDDYHEHITAKLDR